MDKLIYASKAARSMSARDLTALLEQARSRNSSASVTGLLLYADESFMQILEGEAAAIDDIFGSIERDERHGDIRVLTRAPILTRAFEEWSMGFEHVHEELLAKTLPGFRTAKRFPLVSPDLVRNASIAETLLHLFRRNPPHA